MTDVSNEKTLERFSDPDVSFRHLRLCWGLRRIPTSAESQVTTLRSRFGIPGHGSTTPHHRDIPHRTSKKKKKTTTTFVVFFSPVTISYILPPTTTTTTTDNNNLTVFKDSGGEQEKKRKANIKEYRGYPI